MTNKSLKHCNKIEFIIKKFFVTLIIITACFCISSSAIASTESPSATLYLDMGHWIAKKAPDNSVITLEDGTRWFVTKLQRQELKIHSYQWGIGDKVDLYQNLDKTRDAFIINYLGKRLNLYFLSIDPDSLVPQK